MRTAVTLIAFAAGVFGGFVLFGCAVLFRVLGERYAHRT